MVRAEKKLHEKSSLLGTNLSTLGRTLVAYSGGVDSAYLAWATHEAVGSNMLAVIADSSSLPRRELQEALHIGERFGFLVKVIATQEFQNADYLSNELECVSTSSARALSF